MAIVWILLKITRGLFFLSYITYCNIFNIVLLTEVHVLMQQKKNKKKKNLTIQGSYHRKVKQIDIFHILWYEQPLHSCEDHVISRM